jgi:hypothetical protein
MRVMGVAVSSVACLSAAVLMLVVRGAADWSRTFTVVWYGLFGAAVALALAALVVAVRSRAVLKRRLAIAGLALPALLAVPLLIWVIVTLVPLAD